MAGGGSTVRSVPEKDSLAPFLSPNSKGEFGTYVVMADGSVRYLKKGMSDEVFKTICTVDGPKPADWKFDEEYPALTPPKETPTPVPGKAVPVPPGANKGGGAVAAAPKAPKGPLPGWQEYTHQEGGFTISMPAGAADFNVAQPAPGLDAPISQKGYISGSPVSAAMYGAFYAQLPDAKGEQFNDALAKRFLDSALSASGAQLRDEKQVTQGKLQGKEYTIELPPPPPGQPPAAKGPPAGKGKVGKGPPTKAPAANLPLTMYARVFLLEGRAYTLEIGAPGLTPDSPEYKAFFDSFKLIGK
jgi:hypothetical protein